jgi:hypothetical protein
MPSEVKHKITRLDAVNQMLLLAGESLVSDLDENGGLDTETAEFVLDQFTRDFQMRGMANNKYIKKVSLTTKGRLNLDTEVISAELISNHTNDEGYNIIGVAKGEADKYLYNITDQTNQWAASTDYHLELIVAIPWEDLDVPVQRGILSSATRQYQMVTQGDGHIDTYLSQLEILHLSKGKGGDLDDKRRNVFSAASEKLRAARDRRDTFGSSQRFRYWRTSNPGS